MTDKPFVSRGGEKLDAALTAFGLTVEGWTCADFGCNVGGFVDCLLRRGAQRVYAVDTGYGALAWTLRKDPRVVVMERTNALHAAPVAGGVDLVTIDVAFTPQRLIVPAAKAWLRPGGSIVSLLKPHYELAKASARRGGADRQVLSLERARDICGQVCQELSDAGLPPLAVANSPLIGKGGNAEFLLWIRP